MKRIRRGKEVGVPDEWLGKVTSDKTKRLRKQLAKEKILLRRKRLKEHYNFEYEQDQ